LDPVRC